VVCEVLQATWTQSRPSGNTICNGAANTDQPALGAGGIAAPLTSSNTAQNNNFVYFQQGTKSGVKFNDMNANGIRDLPESVGIPGWQIRASTDTNGNGVRDNGETSFSSTTTHASVPSFPTRRSSDLVVCEVLQATWTQSRPSGNTICNGVANTDQPALGAGGSACPITSAGTEQNKKFGNFQQGTKAGVKINNLQATRTRSPPQNTAIP